MLWQYSLIDRKCLYCALQVGLLSVYYPIVNFQEKTKHAKSKLLKLVQDRLGEGDDAETLKAQKEKANERHKNLSFQVGFDWSI